jgi:signal transduction histidine kinase
MMRDITKAKSLSEERDEFVSVVSHELRTPVTIAEGSLSNLQAMYERKVSNPKLTNELLESAHDQILYLASMINDLGTLSRAERGFASTPEVIDIRELVKSLYENYHESAENKGLALDIDIKNARGSIKASRLYIEEVLQNFITNAIKYTAEGSVTIKAAVDKDTATFAVKDTGIGIKRTDQKRIFEKFTAPKITARAKPAARGWVYTSSIN